MAKAEVIKQTTESVSNSLKQSAWIAIFGSLATAILGIFLIVWPETAIKVIAYIVGVFLVVKGAFQIISYFMIKGQNDIFNNDLLFGVITVLIGIAALVMGEEIANIFRIVIGIWMVYEALVRINTSIKLHTAQIDAWKYVLILALCMLVIGIFISFYSGAVVSLIGWMMIISGVFGVVSDGLFIQYVNELANNFSSKK